MISIQATFSHNTWHYSAYCSRKLENTLQFDLHKRPLNVSILEFRQQEVRLLEFTKIHFKHVIISILSLV